MKTKVLILAALASACTAEFGAPDLGDRFYQTATVCTEEDLYEVVTNAALDWNEKSSGRVDMTVLVDQGLQCDVYAGWKAVEYEGGTLPGRVYLDPSIRGDAEALRVVTTHELGHLLIGGSERAHSHDPESVMNFHGRPLLQIQPEDVAKLP